MTPIPPSFRRSTHGKPTVAEQTAVARLPVSPFANAEDGTGTIPIDTLQLPEQRRIGPGDSGQGGGPPELTGGRSLLCDPENSAFAVQNQGQTNGCGTTSLAMALNMLAPDASPYSRTRIDAEVRHLDMFTAPSRLVDYARSQGFGATMVNGLSTDALKREIDQGRPVQILTDVSDNHDGSGLHYQVITGYGTAPDGSRDWEVLDPALGRLLISEKTLMQEWKNLRMLGLKLGFDQFAITFSPTGSATPTPFVPRTAQDDTTPALKIADAVAQIGIALGTRDVPGFFKNALTASITLPVSFASLLFNNIQSALAKSD